MNLHTDKYVQYLSTHFIIQRHKLFMAKHFRRTSKLHHKQNCMCGVTINCDKIYYFKINVKPNSRSDFSDGLPTIIFSICS